MLAAEGDLTAEGNISAAENEAALALKPRFMPPVPNFAAERILRARGMKYICGIDEVGRGPLAGPVAAAAVILDADNLPQGLNDSKKLTAAKRAALYEDILARALAVSFASVAAEAIDKSNIRAAALAVMRKAAAGLSLPPDYALVDGRDIPQGLSCPAAALIKGDARSLSIAAASIIAKYMRDKMMAQAGRAYPAYGFGRHAGYGTAAHLAALAENGVIDGLHRFSFAPIKNMPPQGQH